MIIGDDINITNSDKKIAIFILHLNIQRIDSGKQMRKLENYQYRKKNLENCLGDFTSKSTQVDIIKLYFSYSKRIKKPRLIIEKFLNENEKRKSQIHHL